MGTGAVPARNRDATRNAILEAAGQLIAEKGVDGFSMSEVAQRGNINRALIYHYFQNRDNLVFETIRFIVQRHESMNEGADAPERNFRMHIEHPEIARFLFHLMLNGHPIPRLSSRLLAAIKALEAVKEAQGPESTLDPTFAVITGWLVQISWSFARNEVARQFGITVEEADERVISQMRGMARLANRGLSPSPETR